MLAAAMVFSMAAPGYPAYAVNFGDPVKLKFDPQNGPGVQLSSYSSVASGGAMEGNLFVADGHAGSPLTSSANFAGLPTDDFGSGARPKVPDFNGIHGTAIHLTAGMEPAAIGWRHSLMLSRMIP